MKNKGKAAGLLCLALLFGGQASAQSVEIALKAPETQTTTAKERTLPAQESGTAAARKTAGGNAATASVNKVRLVWAPIPGAVKYKLVVRSSKEKRPDNIVTTQKQIFANGCELDMRAWRSGAADYYWQVCGLNYDGQEIGACTDLKPLAEAESNTDAPLPVTEFTQMDYAPLYPAYSWIPFLGSDNYEIQVWKKGLVGSDQQIRDLYGTGSTYYDDAGYTDPGGYYWKIRALDASGGVLSSWSKNAEFRVIRPTPVAALGDSITHGGGAISTGPGLQIYDWETYSAVPIKNLGYSGNTVEAMCERFERDVLPFSPKILVIMGGVNNYRAGDSAWAVIHNLAVLRDKCHQYGIIPVFATVTPLNPTDIAKVGFVETPPADWLWQQQRINAWIMQQPYAVNVTSRLTDYRGWLRADYTSDGLHPDADGKKYIGEAVSSYLQNTFPDITVPLMKKKASPIPQS